MNAVWVLLRGELRSRWRATLALALLIGLGGGIVMTAAAGARRTDSSYRRFLDVHRGADMLAAANVGGESLNAGHELSVQDFAKMPAVTAVEKLRFYVIRNPSRPADSEEGYMAADARARDRSGPPIDTYKLLEGRLADPNKPGEAVVTLLGRELSGLRVGDRFKLAGLPDVFPDFARAAQTKPLEISIVGRVAAPGDFPPLSGDETVSLHMTPAFYARYPELAFGFPGGVALKFDGRPNAADRFREGYRRAGGNMAITLERSLQDTNVQRSIHLQAIALWLLAALGAASLLLVFGQTLSRQIFIESDDHPTLQALGATRPQLVAVILLRAIVAAIGGAAIAIAVSLALSPLLPTGLARVAEPYPGLAIDGFVAGAGVGALTATVVILGLFPAWRSGRMRAGAGLTAERPSVIAEFFSRAGRLPSLVAGARLALQRGSGRSAMPVRTTIAALTLGIVVLTAAGTFAASLSHFLVTPRLYGVLWDARVGVERPESFTGETRTVGSPLDLNAIAQKLVAMDPRIEGVAVGSTGLNLAVGDTLLETMVIEAGAGRAPLPPLLEGRYPQQRPRGQMQEIVLGRRAIERLGTSVGSTIEASFLDVDERKTKLRVVGVAVVPVFVDSSRLGESALLPPGVLQKDLGLPEDFEQAEPDNLFVAGRADETLVREIARLAGPEVGAGDDVHIWNDTPPSDIVNFGRVQKMPLALGLLLAAFAAATLIHTLITAVNRRRRDLAILKTIGFVRGQVRRAVFAHSLLLTALALAIGIPAGIAAGRWMWRLLAHDLGVLPEPVLQAVTMAIGIAATFAIAVVIAVFPARVAAWTRPATVLRSE
ncbi:MAG: ABC transporter permease [Actinomycetota bacterium]|nr:FtsX-like permease family protein [Actinomycetota bacterium]